MTDRCELTELLVDDCAHCRGIVLESTRTANTGWFPARFSGRCECGEAVEVGDTICLDAAGNVLAECCGRE